MGNKKSTHGWIVVGVCIITRVWHLIMDISFEISRYIYPFMEIVYIGVV